MLILHIVPLGQRKSYTRAIGTRVVHDPGVTMKNSAYACIVPWERRGNRPAKNAKHTDLTSHYYLNLPALHTTISSELVFYPSGDDTRHLSLSGCIYDGSSSHNWSGDSQPVQSSVQTTTPQLIYIRGIRSTTDHNLNLVKWSSRLFVRDERRRLQLDE